MCTQKRIHYSNGRDSVDVIMVSVKGFTSIEFVNTVGAISESAVIFLMELVWSLPFSP